jgi:hypothetical protein
MLGLGAGWKSGPATGQLDQGFRGFLWSQSNAELVPKQHVALLPMQPNQW